MHNNPTATACGTLMGIISYSLRVTAFHNLDRELKNSKTNISDKYVEVYLGILLLDRL